ncbi:Lrp/AsnC family transcriptional regulator [Actinokineospora inagensis]|uniref:Lrp/AsnC family transcriptional regulator n=1 Tax=Actinokineospora inagensis TaxID=103730 RepID=UPI000427018F|nr:Lrp/AsnC family transcriptional regulator [Actinokineospora inagensis]
MPPELSELDQRIASALQVDGRAGPTRIAEVLDISPRTVTRSLTRLSAVLRVVRVPNPRLGLPQVTMLRLRVLRGRVEVIADSLSRHPEVLFIDIVAGAEEIIAVTVGPVPRLPTTQAITTLQSLAVLHVFSDAADWRTGLLTKAETDALTPDVSVTPLSLDPLDHHLITELTTNARLPTPTLAATLKTPESTLRRRLDRLAAAGYLRTCVITTPRTFGLTVDANIWMTVPPGQLPAVGARLAATPQVHGVLATTGPTNLMAAVFCKDMPELYHFVTSLTDIPSAEVTLITTALKRAGHRP